MAFAVGTVVGDYVLVHPMATGARGPVFAAYDPKLDRKIVLRFAKAAGADDRGDAPEFRDWARLEHPNLVAVHNTGTFGDFAWIATEYVDGPTVTEWLKRARPWPAIVDLMCAAGDAVIALRTSGVTTAPLELDDLRVGGDGRVRLIGLGAAAGRPENAKPPAPDQRAFFTALWTALRGTSASSDTIADRHVPRWLRQLCERGMAGDPQGHFSGMDAAIDALRHGRGRANRQRLVAGVVGVGLLAAGGFAVRELQKRDHDEACERVGAAIDADWNEDVRLRTSAGLTETGVSFADTTAKLVGERFDAFRESWREESKRACLGATADSGRDPERAARMAWCLEDQRLEFSALVAAMGAVDEVVVRRAASSALLLPAPTSCSDTAALGRPPPTPPRDRRAVVNRVRAQLEAARARGDLGDDATALTMAQAARVSAESVGWAPLTAMAIDLEATELHLLGRREEALARAASAYETAFAAGAWTVAASAATRLVQLTGTGTPDLSLARAWAQHAKIAIDFAGDPGHIKASNLAMNLGSVFTVAGEIALAEAQLATALRLRRAAFGDRHPRVASVLSTLGLLLSHAGRHAESVDALGRSLAIKQEVLGDAHPGLVAALINLGVVRADQRKFTAARQAYERAVAIQDAAYGPTHAVGAKIRLNLAALALEVGDYDDAQARLDAIAANSKSAGGAGSLEGARALLIQAAVHGAKRDERASQRGYREVLAIYEHDPEGSHDARVAVALTGLGASLARSGDLHAAVETHGRALRIRRAILGSQHHQVAESLTHLAAAKRALGDTKGAATAAAEALKINETARGPNATAERQGAP